MAQLSATDEFMTDSLIQASWNAYSELTETVHELGSATVEANPQGEAPFPLLQVDRLQAEALDALPAPSRLLALAALPGVSFQTAGGGTVRPILRGLSGLRVTTLFYGARIESQAWGEHHGIFLPEEGIERVEVVRGASTLTDTPDAMGGTLRFIPIGPDAEVGRKSALRLTGHSNTSGFQASVVTKKRSESAYHTFNGGINRHGEARLPEGLAIDQSDFRQFYAQGRFGYLRDWGTWDGAYTSAYNTAGLIGTQGWHQSGDHLLTTSLHIQGRGGWNWHPTVSYQLNHRKEFDGGWTTPDAEPALAELDLSLRTTRLDLRVDRQMEAWAVAWGLQSGQKSNTNGPTADSANPFLPDAQMLEAGAFASTGWSRKAWQVNGLLRGDLRTTELASGLTREFPMLSAGLGAQWTAPSGWSLNLNVARKNRAPGLAELGAQGIHHCVSRVEWGNPDLGLETSRQLELLVNRPLQNGWSAQGTLYHQAFSNYLYLRDTGTEIAGYPIYATSETQAELTGLEFSGAFIPATAWTLKWAVAWLHAEDSAGRPLPLIPPANARIEAAWNRVAPNGRTYGVQAINRSSTEAVLLDAGLSVDWNGRIRTQLTATNLLNTEYRTLLSQLNNLGLPEPGRNVKLRVEWHF